MSAFELSWEEFLETHQNWLPGPSIASFIATAFIATAVGAFGIVLTYAVDPGSKWMASTFCWLSLVLFVAAFWDLRIRPAKRRRQRMSQLRALYKKSYSGEQRFSFDQQKWTLETQAGKQEVLWASLLSAAEWPSVMTLFARGPLSAAVPKRSLSPEELDSLRRLALENGGAAWRSSVTLLDLVVSEVPSLWRRYPFLMAEAHLAGLFFSVLIGSLMYGTSGPGTGVGWFLAGLLLFLTLTTQFWYLLIKYQTSYKELHSLWEVGFSEKGIRVKTSKVDVFTAWSSLRNARETTRCFLVYINPSLYYIFPKRCMSAEQQAAVQALLRAKLPVDSGELKDPVEQQQQ